MRARALLCSLIAAASGCVHTRNAPHAAGTAPNDAAASIDCTAAVLRTSTKFSAEGFNTGLPAQGQWRDGFDLADMNGDGHLDLLHGPPRKGDPRPVIFLGDGSGHFQIWSEAHFPPLPYDYGDIRAADFNGDGRMDIALSAHLRGLVTLINEAGGHYAPWGAGIGLREPGRFPDAHIFSSRSIAVMDWNHDGKPDLLALNEGPSRFAVGAGATEALALYLNRDGFWDRVRTPLPLESFGDSLAVGDVNGDGQVDALIGTQVSGSRLLLQIGSPTGYASRELHALPPNAAVTAVALHDFNRDGRADVIDATREIENIHHCTMLQEVLMRRGDREEASVLWRETSLDPVVAIAVGDLDHDGHDDLIAVRHQGAIMMFAGTGRGFTRDLGLQPPADMQGCAAFDAKLANIDAEPGLELIVSYAGEPSAGGNAQCSNRGGFHAWRIHGR